MAMFYAGKRTRNIFDPAAKEPFVLSRTRLDNFIKCARCFYVDRRLGVDQPPGYPFSLNSAVDTLFKKEFDVHRANGTPHPLMEAYGIEAVPFQHALIDEWRDPFKGVRYLDPETNLLVTGGVDDVWENKNGELHVVDYKATSKNGEVNIDADWQHGYKRQIEIYQWLMRKNGFKVSPIGYFVYANGKADAKAFDGKLEFDVRVIPYEGDDSWIGDTLKQAKLVLMQDELPRAGAECEFCTYREAVQTALTPFRKKAKKDS